MAKNYYEILGLSKNCTETDIIIAYRKLAIEHHPRNSLSKDLHKFHDIAEAYEVLTNPKYRECYDKYGEFGLKEGVPSPNSEFIGGYRYIGNSFEIFEKFFGSANPFFSSFSSDKSLRSFGIKSNEPSIDTEDQPSDLIIQVYCTLEELYNGCQKTLTYNRSILNADNSSFRVEQHEKTIEILRGSGNDTEICYLNEGNQYKNHLTTNLVFRIVELPHENFIRQGNDLVYHSKISLVDALAANPMELVYFI